MLTTNINIQNQLINDQMTLVLDKIMLCLVNLREYSFQSEGTVSSRTCMDMYRTQSTGSYSRQSTGSYSRQSTGS